MTIKPIIDPKRIRRIRGGFAFVPHRFLNDGFFQSLDPSEVVLYFFFILCGDRQGVSWYGDPAIVKHTGLSQAELDLARQALVSRKLILVEGPLVQVLELPAQPLKELTASLTSFSPHQEICHD